MLWPGQPLGRPITGTDKTLDAMTRPHLVGYLRDHYVAGNAFWEFSPQWSAVLGLQYQNLHDFSHSFGGRTVTLDLSQSFFATFGVSFNF